MTAGESPFDTDRSSEARTDPAPTDRSATDDVAAPLEEPTDNGRAVSPTGIGEFVRLNGCPQYHHYEFTPGAKERERERKDWKEAFEPLSPLLAVEGELFERDRGERLAAGAYETFDHEGCEDHEGTVAALEAVCNRVRSRLPGTAPIVTAQTYLDGEIGAWSVAGNADFLLFWPTSEGVHVRVLDAKAAHEQKTYQQVQVATYTLLLRELLEEITLPYAVTVSGGVLTRAAEIDVLEPDALPAFDLAPRESDVRRLLVEGGVFDSLGERETGYQLAPKCQGCTYKEACYTNAIESGDVALLGLTRGEQAILAEAGIETLADLAALCHPPDDPRPFEYTSLEPAPERRETYRTLIEEPGLGERLPAYVQRAQAMLGRFDPDHLYGRAEREAPWLLGAGESTLPADDPPYDVELPIARRSLCRIYLHVVYDHRRDRIAMASAYLTSSRHADRGHDPIQVAELSDGVPDDPDRADAAEAALLEAFLERVFAGLRTLATRTERFDRAPIHCYFYTDREREALIEATKRHPDAEGVPALRDLLGLRGAIADEAEGEGEGTTSDPPGRTTTADQPMVSIVEREFTARKAPKVPNSGLLAATGQLTPEEDALRPSDWTYRRADGTQVDLRRAFRHRLFDFEVPYRDPDRGRDRDRAGENGTGEGKSEVGLELLCDPAAAEDYYPSRVRQGATIPLEYVWAATGRLTDEVVERITSGEGHGPVEPFRWVDADGEVRIERADLEELGKTFAAGVAHVERGLEYRSTDRTKRKRPIDLATLESFSLGEADVARTAREFLDLEYATGRRETLSQYALPVVQRVRSGESVPVVVTQVAEVDGELRAEGHLPYDGLFDDGDRVARSSRAKGADESGGGSWMVANELDRTGDPTGSTRPGAIEQGVPVTIEHIDTDAREIAFSASGRFSSSSRYESWHRGWTTDSAEVDDYTVCFEEETVFVLDPGTDDVNGQRAFDALSGAGREANALRELLDGLAAGSIRAPRTDAIDSGAVESYLDWLDSSPGLSPNAEQAAFVRETDGQVSLLQGPPGTGKTAGALAPAILSRALAAGAEGRSFAGLVVGESHKAVDEVAEDVASAATRHRSDPDAPGSFAGLDIVRLREAGPEEGEGPIEYLDYHADTDRVAELAGRLLRAQQGPQRTLGDLAGGSGASNGSGSGASSGSSTTDGEPLLVFATPGRLYGLMGAIGRAARDASGTNPIEEGRSFFDLLAVDEASMMRLPSFLLCGAFVHDSAQILLAGDHRQMPPVRKHDWDREDRRTIEEFAPYCSALDFCRLLRGEAVAGVEEEDLAISRGAELPVTRLEETYRCHETVADFLGRHIYRHDEIDYRSAIDATLDPLDGPAGLADALDSAPLVLVLHEESESQQANPTEAELTAAIAAELDEVGVVTPHNAQKGLLGSRLEEDIEVDTVERFQGGERESIVVSATASDPDFLEAERDFILNPNRLTVAMSRMQKKLVVVASESVFEVVPPDTEGYERARLWKGLYEDLGVLDRDPEWRGTVGAFTGEECPPSGSTPSDSDADGEDVDSIPGAGSAVSSGAAATGVDTDTGVAVYSIDHPVEE